MPRPPTQAKPTSMNAPPRVPVWLLALLLVLMTMTLYWPATRGGFIDYDDQLLVTANPRVQQGLTVAGMAWAWSNPVNCLWHPLTIWSHMLDCQLFGLNPWGHHLTSVLLHALNAALVFLFLQRMTRATWRSLLVAALFAAHPVRVESVVWVAERRGVLSGFFGLLALLAYARYAARGQKSVASNQWSFSHPPASAFYLLSLGFFACGLMSKPTVVMWPFVMLLLDYWPLRRGQKVAGGRQKTEAGDTRPATPVLPGSTAEGGRNPQPGAQFTFKLLPLVVEKLPFFILAALGSVVTFLVQKHAGSLVTGERLPPGASLGNALISYCRYLGKLFWPKDLAVFYPHPGYWALWKVLVAGGLILGISALVWRQRRRYPWLLVGWLWYCGALLPVSQVIQTGDHAMADRYAYLPLLGVVILVIWGGYELTRAWRNQAAAWGAVGAVIVLCAALTRQQIGYWWDTETLFRHALEVTENSFVAHANLGAALAKRGQIDEAITQLQEGIRLKPDYALAHYNLGNALMEKGQSDEAIRQYQEAIRLKPDDPDPHNNLGFALSKKGQIAEAIRQFQEVLQLQPDDPDAHYNLGVALARRGQIDEAIRQYQEALRLKPDYAEVHNDLGTAFYQQGRTAEAIRQFQEALRLKPDYSGARRNLDAVLGARAGTSPPAGSSTNR